MQKWKRTIITPEHTEKLLELCDSVSPDAETIDGFQKILEANSDLSEDHLFLTLLKFLTLGVKDGYWEI